MNVLHLDIETTGLNPNVNHVRQLAAVLDGPTWIDKPVDVLPSFNMFIKRDVWHVDEYNTPALGMQFNLIKEEKLDELVMVNTEYQVMQRFVLWIQSKSISRITLCGKNVSGFDWQFLLRTNLPGLLESAGIKVAHRMIDLGSLCLRASDFRTTGMQDMAGLMKRYGVPPIAQHDALNDCRIGAHILRGWYREQSMAEPRNY